MDIALHDRGLLYFSQVGLGKYQPRIYQELSRLCEHDTWCHARRPYGQGTGKQPYVALTYIWYA